MRPFEYASPTTEAEAVDALNDHDGQTMVLAGGTDLISLLQRDAVQTQRVVDIKKIDTLKTIEQVDDGVLIGATVTLDEALESPLLAGPALPKTAWYRLSPSSASDSPSFRPSTPKPLRKYQH